MMSANGNFPRMMSECSDVLMEGMNHVSEIGQGSVNFRRDGLGTLC